jgi:hypothetical protein
MGGGASIAFCATSEDLPPPRKRGSGRDHATNFTPKSSGDPVEIQNETPAARAAAEPASFNARSSPNPPRPAELTP